MIGAGTIDNRSEALRPMVNILANDREITRLVCDQPGCKKMCQIIRKVREIENLPVADNTADVVISNCVINLSPSKLRGRLSLFI